MEPIAPPIVALAPDWAARVSPRLLRRLRVAEGGCWLWTGPTEKGGYARLTVAGGERAQIHRAAHLMWVGPIPDGYEVDHRCHSESDCRLGNACPHRRCCRPDHLRAVTLVVNRQAARRPGGRALPDGTCAVDPTHLFAQKATGSGCRRCHAAYHRAYRRGIRRRSDAA